MTDLAATGREVPRRPGQGAEDLEPSLERHRVELTAYCYRMLGSTFEAEDAVQETLVRAWRGLERFEGRSALRSWLYRIATNVCLDMLSGRARRARPMELGPPQTADDALGAPLPEATWVQPIPDRLVVPSDADPADVAVSRETIRLAFVTALQHLPPRQRAVLILREVLHWRANEVAALLDTTVASVNSALQRARASLDAVDVSTGEASPSIGENQRELLDRYVDAFERYDLDALTSLLREDARLSMPPFALWLRGADEICRWFVGQGAQCRGSRLLATTANGSPAFAHYHPGSEGDVPEPFALQVIEIADGRIAGIDAYLDTPALFPLFGLPDRPPA